MPDSGMCLLGQDLGVAPCGSDEADADRDPLQVTGRCDRDCRVTAGVQLATWHHWFVMELGGIDL